MKLFKRTSVLITAGVIAIIIGFAGGVYASQWLSFTGDDQVAQSDNHVDEIMDILRDVNQDKLTAEQALAELQEIDHTGLQNRITELEGQLASKQQELDSKQQEIENKQGEINAKQEEVNQKQKEVDNIARERDEWKQKADSNGQYVQHLEQELQRANEKVQGHNAKTTEAVEEARNYRD